jgi:microcystin-dependent protein/putative cell wall-binding protein/2-oxo-4-hydroxy-4-carboxy--5-ureidoimidazoline (OHCU) decarboxylase
MNVRNKIKKILSLLLISTILSMIFLNSKPVFAMNSSEPFIGQITLFPFNRVPEGWAECRGQILPISSNMALYSLIGIRFGGNGSTNFAIPDLRNASPIPNAKYYISLQGLYPQRGYSAYEPSGGYDVVGAVCMFPYNFVPTGWLPCDGRSLSASPGNVYLYSLIGTDYGGDGVNTFNLPDLRSAEPIPNMKYYICVTGSMPDESTLLGEELMGNIDLFAYGFDFQPYNALECNGQSLPITGYEALYSLVGTSFGGNGVNTFNLPDLRGAVPLPQMRYFLSSWGIYPELTFTTLNSIAITTPAAKTTYKVGEALSITGMVVTGTYSDGTTIIETITTGNVTGFNSSSVAASQTLTVTVAGITTTYIISVAKADGPVLSGVTMNDAANTVTGMTAAMEFSTDGTNWTAYNAVAPNLPDLTGTVALQVRVAATATHNAGQATTFNFTAPILSSIAITTPGKTAYKVGETLDITGMVVTGTYSDGTTKVETIATGDVAGFNSAAVAAIQTLTITVGGKTTTYTISVTKADGPALTGVTMNDAANTVSGMAAAMEFSTDGTNWTTYNAVTPNLPNLTGTVALQVRVAATVTHNAGAAATFNFTVPTLSSIAITTPGKTAYKVGETLDITGMVVTGTYSDGTTKAETVVSGNVTGFNSSAVAATQTLTVTVNGKSTTYTISVTKADGPALAGVTMNDATNTVSGMTAAMEFSTDGTSWTTYNAGTPNLPNLTGTVALQVRVAATATHSAGAGTTFNFTIPTLSSIAITTPGKTAYKVGETLDITGMVVTGTYSDGTTKTETVVAGDVAGFNNAAVAASQTLTITVGGKTTTYTISVTKTDGPALAGVTMNDAANTVTGMTAAMEFSTDGTNWTTYNAVAPNLPSLTGTVALQVRVAATATHNAGAATTFNFTVPTLSSIAITTTGKTAYKVGEMLDITGMVVTGIYSDGTTKVETIAAANVTGFNSSAVAATQTLTVTVNGKSTSYTISVAKADGQALAGVTMNDATNTVSGMTAAMEFSTDGTTWTTYNVGTPNLPDLTGTVALQVRVAATATHNAGAATTFNFTVPTLSSIAITTPGKTAYKVGETLDITGMVVTGTYSDGTTKVEAITTANVTGFNSSAVAATQTLTVTVNGKSTTYTISITKANGPALSGVTMNDAANTVTGMNAAMEFSTDGTNWTAYNAVTPNLPNLTGTVALQVRVAATATHNAGVATTFNFTVPTLSSIGITTPAKTAYKVGEMLDVTGMVVTGTYSDGTTKVETITTGNVTGFNSSAVAASQTLTVTVAGRTTTYIISVAKADGPVLTGVTMNDAANTVTGMTAAMEFSTDGTNWTAYNAVTPNLPNLTGTVALQVRVAATGTHNAGAATTFNFTVPTLSSIAITTPGKTAYKVGETLDITGMLVTGSYSDGTTKVETITAGNVTGFNSSAVATTQVLTVTVNGKSTTYTISVAKADGLALTGVTMNDGANTVTGMTAAMEFSTDGTNWTAYNAGTPNLPDLTGTVALQVRVAATATHNAGAATTFNFTVPTLSSIAITTPAKTAYKVGETLDITGMVVTGTYSDGTTKVEAITTANVTGFNSSAVAASQTLIVTVNGKSTTYSISVTKADGPALAGVTMNDAANTVSGMTSAMEFSTDGTNWTAYNAVTPNLPNLTGTVVLQIRVAATGTHNAGAATTLNFTVPTLSSLAIKTPMAKLAYTVGEALDITGLVIEGTYSDGSKKTETITVANVTGFNSSAVAASQTLTVTVGGKTATYTIEIKAATVPTVPTPPQESITVEGNVIDKNGESVKGVETKVTTEANGDKTVEIKSNEAILIKQPDGTEASLSDTSKLGFEVKDNTKVSISTDGTIKVKDLPKGTETKIPVTYDLGNGQKITIAIIDIRVSSNGDVNLTSTLIDPYGTITDAITGKAIAGADVKLYYANTERNKAAGKTPDSLVALPIINEFKPNDNKNPQISDVNGVYGFMVFPTSDYYIVIRKDGYDELKSPTIPVEHDIVNLNFKMNKSNIGIKRISGLNRVDTAIEIAKASYTGKLSNVILATANGYSDALTGSVLAYKLNAPILLVGSSTVDQEKVLAYIKANMNSAGTVYILGGTGVVSTTFESNIAARGFKNITRLGGANRYETALRIAEKLDVKVGTPVVLACGENYPDALSISSTAAVMHYPILLVEKDKISDGVNKKLAEIKPIKVYIIGLQGVISAAVEEQVSQTVAIAKGNIVRLGGQDRYETSLAVAKYFNLTGQNLCVATGNNYPDAIAGAVYAANSNSPIILTGRNLSENVVNYLKTRKIIGTTIFGGEAVVSKEVENKLLEFIAN